MNQTIYLKGKEGIVQTEEGDESDGDDKSKKGSGSSFRIDELAQIFKDDIEKELEKLYQDEIKIKPLKKKDDAEEIKKVKAEIKKGFSLSHFVMKKCVDVRLFGGISTKKKDAVQFTGPVQFALLNPSLNKVNFKMHQNTTHFTSKAENTQGSIGTTTLVPYSLIQIHGWFNPEVAKKTGMTAQDMNLMFEGLWYGTSGDGSSHSRSKVGQNSILLLEIVYTENNKKVYGVDKLIEIKPKNDKKGEQLRSLEDFDFDFEKLIETVKTEKVEKVNYFTEDEEIKKHFEIQDSDKENGVVKEGFKWKEKFKLITFEAPKKENE